MRNSSALILQLLTILVGVVLLTPTVCAQYCASGLCPANRTHIACNNTGAFSPSCPSNASLVNMTTLRFSIVQRHNFYRNLIAGGFRQFNPAARMATMRWNTELANIASFNVKRCRLQHDQCRNTIKFRRSGQNLALLTYSATSTQTNREIVFKLLNRLFREYVNTTTAQINSYTRGSRNGHFTVIVNDKNLSVGCAAVTYTRNNFKNFLLACNYARTNILNRPVYITGAVGSQCILGTNPRFPNLCNPNEFYDINIP